VNWAPHNPAPHAGMVRLWCLEAFAHGAEVVSIFRWRQAPFGQEQMHAGLLSPDGRGTTALDEFSRVANEAGALSRTSEPAPVALAFDYESAWAYEIEPQGEEFSYFDLVFDAYRALRRLGLSVDIIGPDLDGLAGRKLVVVPGLFHLSERARTALANTGAQVLLGPRTGAKTKNFQIPSTLPPGLGAQSLDVTVKAVESLRPDTPVAAGDGAFRLWREFIEVGDAAVAQDHAEDGHPTGARQGNISYIAGWPDPMLWRSILLEAATKAHLQTVELTDGLRVQDCGEHRMVFNYSPDPKNIETLVGAGLIFGSSPLAPFDVALARKGSTPGS
ncbi:MAG: beta-galactosidase trimerization domain-containing protein, partial [Pseudomonadota bacterium]